MGTNVSSPSSLKLLVRPAVLLVLAAYVLASACAKAFDMQSFRVAVASHGVVAKDSVDALADTFVLAEVLIALGAVVLVGWSRSSVRWAGLLLGALFVSLSAYAAYLTANPPPKPVGCGCGLSVARIVDWKALTAQNSLCGALAIVMGIVRPVPSFT